MLLTIELPRPLDEEMTLEAQRKGVPTGEHATLLLYLATALLNNEEPTPFQEAVREFPPTMRWMRTGCPPYLRS